MTTRQLLSGDNVHNVYIYDPSNFPLFIKLHLPDNIVRRV